MTSFTVPHLPAAAAASAIDASGVHWAGVRRARFYVRHHYQYIYRQPISDLSQRLIMTPPDRHEDQVLLDHSLAIAGTAGQHTVTWNTDRFGNRVALIDVPAVDEAITFEAEYCVERRANHTASAREVGAYLETTALTAPDAHLTAAADAIRREGGDAPEVLTDLAHTWAARAITYQVGATGVQTPAAMALHLGKGVCQDYAHLLLAVLRLLDIPARYVSGHLLGEGVPHAWVEAFIPDTSVPGGMQTIAYDPTHERRADLRYLTVATGRDFADVSPTSGTFTGAALGTMSWGKRATLVEIECAPAGGGVHALVQRSRC